MTGCLNGGSCLFEKKMDTFTCSCKLPWSGDKCDGRPFPSLFIIRVTVNSLVSGHPRELKRVSVSRAVRLRELFP